MKEYRVTVEQLGKIKDMENTEKPIKCCLCGEDIAVTPTGWRYGNNPQPLTDNDEDRCCDLCNSTKVIPKRIEGMFASKNKNIE